MRGFQDALLELSFDPTLARIFANTTQPELERLAEWIATADPYGERAALARALEIASASPDLVREHAAHRLWCARREATWTAGLAEPPEMRVTGMEWIDETAGHPTMVIAPMTLATTDAMHAISKAFPAERPCIVFGEDIDGNAYASHRSEVVSGASSEVVPRIREVLDQGGVLCTYADFVYDGRGAQSLELFGAPRPVSKGFLSLAAQDETMLLPIVALRREDAISVEAEEPIEVHLGADAPATRPAAREALAPIVGNLLETLIRRAPEQWLLLPTLTFNSPQMAIDRS